MAKDLEDLGAEALASVEEEKEIEVEVDVELEFDASAVKTESPKIESTTIENPEPTPEEAEAMVAQKKARVVQVMSRGITNEKLQLVYDSCVPEGYSGKFVLDDEGYIIRYSNLGFGFKYTDGAIGVHGRADNRIAVGDVVLMTITLEDRAILKEVKAEATQRHLGAGKKEYKRLSEKHADEGGPAPIDLAPSA